ncbi:MAG: hypothetical protein GPJ54_15545 [Candidatus Heimdallarchaeota archaeon]|nr:hypothetical protein [Candidatus Heimdallarchaeota archaeon]
MSSFGIVSSNQLQFHNTEKNSSSFTKNSVILEQESRKPEDLVKGIAVDSKNNIWVVGEVGDGSGSLIAEGFLSKISPTGEILDVIPIKYDDDDIFPQNLAIDSADNLIISGTVKSSSIAFNAEFPSYNGKTDAFIQKYNPTGVLLWSTYVGGSGVEFYGIVNVDADDNVIFGATTGSSDMPLLNSTYTNYVGGADIPIDYYNAKFSPQGELIWSNYIGGKYRDQIIDIEIDTDGNIISLLTATSPDLPFTSAINNATLSDCDNLECYDGVIYSQNENGEINWGVYLAGEFSDWNNGIELDTDNQIIIGGLSESADYPVTNDAFDNAYNALTDGVITKLDNQGNLTYGSYVGGSNADFIMDIGLDSQNNLIAVGSTGSNDYPRFNSNIGDQSLQDGNFDLFVTKFDENNNLLFSFQYGSLYDPTVFATGLPFVTLDNNDNILITGGSVNPNFPLTNTEVNNIYPYNFGGGINSYLIKLNPEGEILWSTMTLIVTDPELDYDGDGFTNQEEYDLCIGTASICLDATNPDTDGDGMYDKWEWENGLRPENPLDGAQDNDFDLLSNREEFFAGTDPNDPDSDDDGMPDGWEVLMNLDPGTNDADLDRDEDGMPNAWEFLYQFNATDGNDALLDFDSDGVSNLNEYDHGTDPTKKDTDLDGINDAWEIENDLDPLDPKDATKDFDNDLFPNKLEYDLGTNPQSPIEGILVLALVSIIMIVIYRIRQKRKGKDSEAQELGFLNIKDQQKAKKAGFASSDERMEARLNGFLNNEIKELLNANGISNESEIVNTWVNLLKISEAKFSVSLLNETEALLSKVNSLEELHEVELKINLILDEIKVNKSEISNLLEIENKLFEMMKRSPVLVSVEVTEINDTINLTNKVSVSLNQLQSDIEELLNQKQQWFEPWSGMLEFIQLTEDGKEIHISQIAEIMRTPIEHAEALLTALLTQNSFIGVYDDSKKTYSKGTNVNDYLEKMLADARRFDEESEA